MDATLYEKDLCEIVEENDLEVKGDASLLNISKKSKFSREQLCSWKEELAKLYPQMDDHFLDQILQAYSTHPHIIDDLAAEHKINPEKFVKTEDEPLQFPEGSNMRVIE